MVHYHDGLSRFARRSADALERAHALLVPIMRHAPSRKTQVVISDDTDFANGSATAFLRPTMRLYAVPPDDRSELGDYDDYLFTLVIHEYTHILHLDQASGLNAAVNLVFGKLLQPNGLQPDWIVEGYAIHHESLFTSGGRARSSLNRMMLRSEVLEQTGFGIDDASNSPLRWPRGSLGYLHGSHLIPYVTARFGEEAMVALSREYGGRLIPYALNLNARAITGRDWLELYADWRSSLEALVAETVADAETRDLTGFTRLTLNGERHDSPRFSPRGDRVFYVEQSADRRAGIRSVRPDGTGDRLELETTGGGSFTFAPDGRSLVFSQPDMFRQFYFYEDLYRADLETGRLERLTAGARVAAPDLSPDGRLLVAVQRRWGGRTALVTLPLEGATGNAEPTTLYEPPEGSVLFTPRFSPDGRSVAFSEHRDGRRDIRLLELSSGEQQQITSDRALDLNPTFDPSGRFLLFASDRTGIYNLYAFDLQTRRTLQITNVLTGAFRPAVSPDGRSLTFVSYSAAGYDISTLPFDPAGWWPAPRVDLERPAPVPVDEGPLYPERAYSPLQTLAPQYWLPVLASDPSGMALGLSTGGADVVGRHTWSLQGTLGVFSLAPAFDASWAANVIYPRLGLNAASFTTSLAGGPADAVERQSSLTGYATFPFSRAYRNLSITLSHELRYFAPSPVPLPSSPAEKRPFIPVRGLASVPGVSVYFSNAQRFANGISTARGQSLGLNLRMARPELGSDFTYAAIDGSAAQYLTLPFFEHHVLALRMAGGTSAGELGGRRVFALGGIGVRDPLLDAITLSTGRSVALKGYRGGAFVGRSFVLGNAEYRFPLAVVDAGLYSFPAYLRRLHGAVSFDIGQAADRLAPGQLKPSLGLELRSELTLAYGFTTDLRLGYARGLASEGINEFFLTLGSGF